MGVVQNANISYRGLNYKNNEAAFQAQKVLDNKKRLDFSLLNPSEAKKMGRIVLLRKDWEKIKEREMYYKPVRKAHSFRCGMDSTF